MGSYPYVTFAYTGPDGVRPETVYLPSTSQAERYARALAPELFRHRYALQRAYVNPSFTVLVPRQDLPTDEVAKDVDGAFILGEPMKVVTGIDEPMLAYSLKRTAFPDD